ncbi:head scaffolding protein [Vibrio phage EniLVp02]
MAELSKEELELVENIVKRVHKDGSIERVLDRKTRKRRATQTTGLDTATRKLIARKAARTRRNDKGGVVRAMRQRKRTLNKRKAMGIK